MRVITFISTNLGEIKAINIFIRIQIPYPGFVFLKKKEKPESGKLKL